MRSLTRIRRSRIAAIRSRGLSGLLDQRLDLFDPNASGGTALIQSRLDQRLDLFHQNDTAAAATAHTTAVQFTARASAQAGSGLGRAVQTSARPSRPAALVTVTAPGTVSSTRTSGTPAA